MALMADLTFDGRALGELLSVTPRELAAEMNTGMLLKAAQDEDKQLATWIKKTKWSGLPDQVADRVCSFFDGELVDIFAGAWAKYAELKKCARETCENPSSTMTVALAEHDFTYEIGPAVDVLINGVKLATIPFKVGILCAVSGLELFLKAGAVHDVRSGKCDFKAQLWCAKQLVWERPLMGVDLPGELHLNQSHCAGASDQRQASRHPSIVIEAEDTGLVTATAVAG
jgi:hypothetical protein